MKAFFTCLVFLFFAGFLFGQQQLTVEKIMRDPQWIGTSPNNLVWSADSKNLYFFWNPEKALNDSLYTISLQQHTPVKVAKRDRVKLPNENFQFNKQHTKIVYEKNGDIYFQDLIAKQVFQITNTLNNEYAPVFSGDGKKIFFTGEQNLFSWEIATGKISQHTDFRKGKKIIALISEQEKWLRKDQLDHFDVLKDRDKKQTIANNIRKSESPARPKEIYLDEKTADMIRVSPDEKYITFRVSKNSRPKNTIVPNYVTTSGFTEDISARTKVGAAASSQELFIYDIAGDTVLQLFTSEIPGINDKIEFKNITDEKTSKQEADKKSDPRQVNFFQLSWSENSAYAAVSIRSLDNKDRWIALVDPLKRKLIPLDRMHDDAWVNTNTGWSYSIPNSGWLDNAHLWFLSEETGYSHLYVTEISSGTKKPMTRGNYEVQNVDLPDSKKYFYLITNEVHPGEKQLYRLPVSGGKAERMTTMTGAHEIQISPDEKNIAFRYSYSNKPWELFIMENKPGAKAEQVTNSLSEEFKAYPWRDPELVTFKARDNATLYARLYKPKNPNGAAVVFVHGAGYLQNAHKWWSNYFREYMFHNLLADKGFTVLDIDYRASAGYGRDWRTGIYQFMGGKDLTDNLDGAKFLIDQHNIDPKRIGIYGGSYGGFITLMAMFTAPDVFAAGAALRPVTDWAHYSHPYTSNILNLPYTDSIAYAKSSPIYYAAGLKGSLLICHGMVDVNVHFQDVVRLSQRLIELGKDNWELAVYPMEDHGFVEPSSWTDEYKRILRLFETKLR